MVADENDAPLPDILYRRLRSGILSGTLKPGQILRQEELARQSNVSRVPLREAMGRLEADGLVVLRPRRGYAVRSLDESEIVEIYELRAVVEQHAGEIAARARTKDDVQRVNEILRKMEALDVGRPECLARWATLNYDFHANIIAAGRRPRLARTAEALRAAIEPYLRRDVESHLPRHIHQAERDHREIFEAFRAGDAHGLGQLCRQHVEYGAQRLLTSLRQSAASQTATDGQRRGRYTDAPPGATASDEPMPIQRRDIDK
jgi:DNA-binding GntR family transcriptional regulator